MRLGNALRFAILGILWGSSFLWIAVALRSFSPAQIVLGRLALGAAVLLAVAHHRRSTLPRGWSTWGHLSVAALLANALPYTLFGVAEQHIASGVTGVINATTPLWTVLLSLAIGYGERLTISQWVGVALGFVGVLLIFSPWRTASQIASIGGIVALIAAASYGVSYIYMDRFLVRQRYDAVALSASQLLAATAMMTVAVPFVGLQSMHFRWDALVAVLILGAFGTGFAYIINYQLLASEGTLVSLVAYIIPVVAVILGAIFLGEKVQPQIIGGMILVLGGVALTKRTRARQRMRVPMDGQPERAGASAPERHMDRGVDS